MYYLNKTVKTSFEEAEKKIREELKEVGFGILTEIDMEKIMKMKLGKEIGKYKILGACNPKFAYDAIKAEKRIGIMLPCNVTLIENNDKTVDVSIMDPESALSIVKNDEVDIFASEVKEMLNKVMEKL